MSVTGTAEAESAQTQSPAIARLRSLLIRPESVTVALLILAFIGMTWVAAKIYRTGILMYGKKVNYREMWKWIRYS